MVNVALPDDQRRAPDREAEYASEKAHRAQERSARLAWPREADSAQMRLGGVLINGKRTSQHVRFALVRWVGAGQRWPILSVQYRTKARGTPESPCLVTKRQRNISLTASSAILSRVQKSAGQSAEILRMPLATTVEPSRSV
jgi:hypothetical protein